MDARAFQGVLNVDVINACVRMRRANKCGVQRITIGRHVIYKTTASPQQGLILCAQYALADQRLSVLTGLVSHYLVRNRVCEQYGECNFP